MNPNPIGKAAPSPQDVILGRGGHANHHLGNAVFRSVVTRAKPVYNAAPKTQKIIVARSIVEAVHKRGNPPGRFLQKNKADGLWYEVSFEKAVDKTKQALREKSWKKEETTEEDEEAERVGMQILDLPALQARVSSSCAGGGLMAKLSSSKPSSAGKKRRAQSPPSASACTKPHCAEPSLALPPACTVRPPFGVNTAPRNTAAASAKKDDGSSGTYNSKFQFEMGPIPTTLARLTTSLIKGSVEGPPPEKKQKILRSVEEDGHRRAMHKLFLGQEDRSTTAPASHAGAAQQQQRPSFVAMPPPSFKPAMKVPSIAPMDGLAMSPMMPSAALAQRPVAMQSPSKSVPAYGAYGTGFGGSFDSQGSSQLSSSNMQQGGGGLPSPPMPMTSPADRVPTFCNPFEDEDDEDASSGGAKKPAAAGGEPADWQKAWKSGGASSRGSSQSPPLKSETTNFFSSLFFGRGNSGGSSHRSSSQGSAASTASAAGEMLTSLARKASDTVMTVLGRGLSAQQGKGGCSGPVPALGRALSGNLSRGISLGLGRGLTMAMGLARDETNLPNAGPAMSFDWGDDGGNNGAQKQKMQRRMSLIDDDDDERPELARLRSLETSCRTSLIDDDEEEEHPQLTRLRSLERNPAA
eukprot:CAMPEP_0197437828 /NCGR_PEP_ID=MMETSP1175-20131217/4973_1 /TAXON_ID=1003142 /ORGANISM="Triceratium dubium, Strain CCMP147" /LENGTH=635 /DNA_ID=CAMNT_0042967443 /DNA_START=291 /DNA_END=2198 /DNA_ORIENTATION=+